LFTISTSEKKEKVGSKRGSIKAKATSPNNPAGIKIKMMKGIIGKKLGMTSVYDPSGKQTACTIIEAGPCVVTQVKTKETDGYSALQLSFGEKKRKSH